MSERDKLIELFCEAKKTDPESAPFSEFLADYLIANGVTIQQWIPVTERLPLYDKNVLAVDRITGEITTAYLNMFDSFVFKDGRCHGASYWMPLPEPPKGE